MNIIRKVHAEKRDGMTFVLSDETPDRMGDIIMADGWDLTDFRKNPIALFGHRSDFPLGTWKDMRVEKKQLLGELEPAPKGTSERADEIIRFIEAGVLKAVSVGFAAIEREPRKIGDRYVGEIFTKQTLLETSVVSIPANPNALAVARELNLSEETRKLVFAEHGIKSDKPAIDHMKMHELEKWSPAEARKVKLWMADLERNAPYFDKRFYRKLFRLFDELETVRTIALVMAEQGNDTTRVA